MFAHILLQFDAQDGTAEDEFLSSVAIQADGSILLGGDTWGDWDGANAGERDFSMVALSPDGEELWRWQVKLKSSKKILGLMTSCFSFLS